MPDLAALLEAHLFWVKQCMWIVGGIFDNFISEAAVDLEKKPREPEHSAEMDLGAGRLQVGSSFDDSWVGQENRNLAYWHAGRQAFQGVRHLGWAADCSRVGGRSIMLQAISGQRNQAMWLAPQARDSLRKRS
eukprot:9735526-Lingulodinium_polyedra.AAC.1